MPTYRVLDQVKTPHGIGRIWAYCKPEPDGDLVYSVCFRRQDYTGQIEHPFTEKSPSIVVALAESEIEPI